MAMVLLVSYVSCALCNIVMTSLGQGLERWKAEGFGRGEQGLGILG